MGMYTEIVIKSSLIKGISKLELEVLEYLFNEGELPKELPDHEFFTKPRWDSIGRSCSYYHHPKVVNSLYRPEWDTSIIELYSRSDLKNYDGEIKAFFDWFDHLSDASEGEIIGYSWYEESDMPTFIRKR